MSEDRRDLRERIENANPERAAESAAARFERDSIPVPPALMARAGAERAEQQICRDTARLYRELVIAEPLGLSLTELLAAGYLEPKRHTPALAKLRASGVVSEGSRGADLSEIDRIFLRPKGHT